MVDDQKWEEVPVPECPPSGFVVKMIASGVCRSDHSILHDEKPPLWFQQKFTLGHEGCGRIVKIGSDVKDDKFQVVGLPCTLLIPVCTTDIRLCREAFDNAYEDDLTDKKNPSSGIYTKG